MLLLVLGSVGCNDYFLYDAVAVVADIVVDVDGVAVAVVNVAVVDDKMFW